jgi:perosamine synthetase
VGGIPVFCEIGDDYVISLKSLEQIIKRNDDAKYIIPVHLYGHPCNMDAIKHLTQKKEIVIVEDRHKPMEPNARARESAVLEKQQILVFILKKYDCLRRWWDDYHKQQKNLRVYRKDARCRQIDKVHSRQDWYTMRLNSVNTTIGKVQLKHIDEWNEKRRSLAEIYHDKLKGII